MKILLVTDSYPPEIRSASQLMYELSYELRCRGHEVTVITTCPGYNIDHALNSRKYSEFETELDINIIRVKTLPHHNVNYIIRGISQLVMPLQFTWKLFRYKIKSDAVIIYSPPLTLGLVGFWLKFFKTAFLLNIQDIFPQNAIDLGILKNKYQIAFFEWLEKFIYEKSDLITAHSSSNKEIIVKKISNNGNKVEVLNNWININQIDLTIKNNYRNKWGITHKYIAIFAGVMGPSQNLLHLLEIAKEMQDQSDLLFLFVGDGAERESLVMYAKSNALRNVRFERFVSPHDYVELLKICNIGLVCLSPLNLTPVVPGKILGYMAAGLPVAAFLNKESDAHQLIKEANCGFSARSDDFDSSLLIMRKLLNFQGDDLKKMGENGFEYAKKNFSKDVCISKIELLLKKITKF